MFTDIVEKRKKGNAIFFSRDSLCLQPLIDLICKQNHKTMILWAFRCVQTPLNELEEKYPLETRWRKAVELADLWSKGEVKMRVAQRAILDAHAVAKELDNPIDIALCHALGQAVATVHVESHAIGLPFYELTAIVLKNLNSYEDKITEKIKEYMKVLIECSEEEKQLKREWASFILKDRENRELAIKTKKKSC